MNQRRVTYWNGLTQFVGTDGWCRGVFWADSLNLAMCSRTVKPTGKARRYCRNTATHARWADGGFEKPLCTTHWRALDLFVEFEVDLSREAAS
jgi:hypothetical protein